MGHGGYYNGLVKGYSLVINDGHSYQGHITLNPKPSIYIYIMAYFLTSRIHKEVLRGDEGSGLIGLRVPCAWFEIIYTWRVMGT